MKTERIEYLLEKYLSQNYSSAEKDELGVLISSLEDEELKARFHKLWLTYSSEKTLPEKDSQEILNNILLENRTLKQKTRKRNDLSISFRRISVAASLLILISLGFFINNSRSLNKSNSIISKADIVSPNQPTAYIRHLTLPDGSTVILKSGSTLQYPNEFAGKTREVTLKGEAYFDVKHMNSKPFIIHTNNVKTTVLGTAFDIKAWPDKKNITVSVTRGKVRVEDDKNILAVLTKNKQLNYDMQVEQKKEQKVNAEKVVTDWTQKDLNFDHKTLAEVALTLSKRYQKDIKILNSELANSTIVATFRGTESLQVILEVLCALNKNTHYRMSGNEVVLYN